MKCYPAAESGSDICFDQAFVIHVPYGAVYASGETRGTDREEVGLIRFLHDLPEDVMENEMEVGYDDAAETFTFQRLSKLPPMAFSGLLENRDQLFVENDTLSDRKELYRDEETLVIRAHLQTETRLRQTETDGLRRILEQTWSVYQAVIFVRKGIYVCTGSYYGGGVREEDDDRRDELLASVRGTLSAAKIRNTVQESNESTAEAAQPCEGVADGALPGESTAEAEQPCEGIADGALPGESIAEAAQPCEGVADGVPLGESTAEADHSSEGTAAAEAPNICPAAEISLSKERFEELLRSCFFGNSDIVRNLMPMTAEQNAGSTGDSGEEIDYEMLVRRGVILREIGREDVSTMCEERPCILMLQVKESQNGVPGQFTVEADLLCLHSFWCTGERRLRAIEVLDGLVKEMNERLCPYQAELVTVSVTSVPVDDRVGGYAFLGRVEVRPEQTENRKKSPGLLFDELLAHTESVFETENVRGCLFSEEFSGEKLTVRKLFEAGLVRLSQNTSGDLDKPQVFALAIPEIEDGLKLEISIFGIYPDAAGKKLVHERVNRAAEAVSSAMLETVGAQIIYENEGQLSDLEYYRIAGFSL